MIDDSFLTNQGVVVPEAEHIEQRAAERFQQALSVRLKTVKYHCSISANSIVHVKCSTCTCTSIIATCSYRTVHSNKQQPLQYMEIQNMPS